MATEIPASDIKPGYSIRRFFTSDFGLHRIDGEVEMVEDDTLAGGQPFRSVTLREARCTDVYQTKPGIYLYGDGLTMTTYGLGLLPGAKVTLLATEPIVCLPHEIDPQVIPEGSIWNWHHDDGSIKSKVSVDKFEDSPNGYWVYFTDTLTGSEWALDLEAFEGQCTFDRLADH